MRRIDLTGRKFGNLEVVRLSDTRHKTGSRMWECLCHACGKTALVLGYSLLHGHYKSCGCIQPVKRDVGVKRHIEKDRVDGTRISSLKSKLHKHNKSGHKGVIWMESRGKWRAYIGYKGKNINLGYYAKKEDAINARKRAEEKYHLPHIKKQTPDN